MVIQDGEQVSKKSWLASWQNVITIPSYIYMLKAFKCYFLHHGHPQSQDFSRHNLVAFYIFTWLSDREVEVAKAVLSPLGSHHGTAGILRRLTETSLMRNSLQRCGYSERRQQRVLKNSGIGNIMSLLPPLNLHVGTRARSPEKALSHETRSI